MAQMGRSVRSLVVLVDATLALYLNVQNATDHDNAEEVLYARIYGSSGIIRGLPILPIVGARWRF